MIPAGTAGTRKTLSIMRQLVIDGKKSPVVRQLAVDLTRDLPQKDNLEEIKTLHAFVRDRIRYVKDIKGVETLHTPEKILQNKAGDCDDKTVLLSSLLESLGFATRMTALGFAPPVKDYFGKLQAKNYSHVLPEVLLAGKWLPLETTEPVEVGWAPKNAKSALIIYNSPAKNTASGLSGKRVKAARAAQAAAMSAAVAKASDPNATDADKAKAAELQAGWQAEEEAHAKQRKVKQKAKSALIKKVAIGAAVIGAAVFTLGAAGGLAAQALTALKAGGSLGVEAAKKLLMGAASNAASKGAKPADVAQAQQFAADLEEYPPDPSLTSLDAMIADSQTRKLNAQASSPVTWLIPAGLIAALFLI